MIFTDHPDFVELTVEVNGRSYVRTVATHLRLLDFLRKELRLTGAKEVCGEGECGACTIVLNEKLVNACLIFAIEVQNAKITTIEDLMQEDQLDSLQQAFIDYHSVQCGYCIPGMILTGEHILSENSHPSREQIKDGLAGNMCRCTGYRKIIDAIEQVGKSGS